LEDGFEAEDAKVRRSAACWVVGRATGSAATRKQRVHMFLEAMITPVLALGVVVYNGLYSSVSLDVSRCPKEMARHKFRRRLEQ
jgi:hypothetical protein